MVKLHKFTSTFYYYLATVLKKSKICDEQPTITTIIIMLEVYAGFTSSRPDQPTNSTEKQIKP